MTDSTSGSAARSAVYIVIGNVARIAFNAILFFFVARILGVEELGRFQFALSYCALFAILTQLGLNDLIIREVATNAKRANTLFTISFIVKVAVGCIVFIATIITAYLTGKSTGIIELILIAAFSGSIVANLGATNYAFFISFRRVLTIQIIDVVRYTLTLGLGLLALFLDTGGFGVLTAILIAQSVYLFLTYYFLYFGLGLRFTKFSLIDIPKLVFRSFPFALAAIFYTVFAQSGYTILGYMENDRAVGEYTAAAKLVNYLTFLPKSIYQAIFPILAKKYIDGSDTITKPTLKTLRYTTALALPIAIFMHLRAAEIIGLAFGDEYLAAAVILKVAAIGIPFAFLTYIIESAVYSMYKEKLDAVISGIVVLLNIGLNIVLISYYGAIGAALAYVITVSLHSIARVVIVSVKLPGFNLFRELLPLVPAALLFGATVYFLGSLHILLQAPIAFVGYVLILIVSRGIFIEDIAAIIRRD